MSYFKHGYSRCRGGLPAPEFRAWQLMLQRCYNPKCKSFVNYGARGITVCDAWRESFKNFLRDLGDKPTPLHSLERINNDLGYGPSNCKWATSKEQNRNSRNSRLVHFDGHNQSIAELSERYGITQVRLTWRLNKGWDIEKALFKPARKKLPNGWRNQVPI
jgi:hypothetical protein